MTVRPDIRQSAPRPSVPDERLPIRPVAVTPRNGLPETAHYTYHGPLPLPGVAGDFELRTDEPEYEASATAAALNAGSYRCPHCRVTATVGRTVRAEHKPGCPRGEFVRSLLERAS